MTWPEPERLVSGRLVLEPLSVDHAAEMVGVLADRSLYDYTGGDPPTRADLDRRYAAQAVGRSPDGSQCWLNWIVRDGAAGSALGYVQATLEYVGADLGAELSWVVSPAYRGRGIATEAARAMIDWLHGHAVEQYSAHVHPRHEASIRVARKLGLHPTTEMDDGEVRWSS